MKSAGRAREKFLISAQKTLNGYDHVKYEEVVAAKTRFARELFQRQKADLLASDAFKSFFAGNRHWLEPYAAFSALRDLYKTLTPWQKCQVARHPERPHCLDYVEQLFTEFTSLAGDRAFADDRAIVGGVARPDLVEIRILPPRLLNDRAGPARQRSHHRIGSHASGKTCPGGR